MTFFFLEKKIFSGNRALPPQIGSSRYAYARKDFEINGHEIMQYVTKFLSQNLL